MSNALLRELSNFKENEDLEQLEQFLIRSGASVLAEELAELVLDEIINVEGQA